MIGADNCYDFDWPDVYVSDLLSGSPHYHFVGKFTVKNPKHKLISRVEFIEDQKDGWVWKDPRANQARNQLRVSIVKPVEKTEIPVAEGSGMVTRYLEFEGKTYWRHYDPVPVWTDETPTSKTLLPSSSVLRKELRLIQERNYAEADRIMEAAEIAEDKFAALRAGKPKTMKK